MINTKSHIEEILKEERIVDSTIIILKGFDTESICDQKIDLAKLITGSKIEYFSEIVKSKRKYLSYEEYIYLFDFIYAEFTSIIVIQNNLYMNLYPLSIELEPKIIEGLKIHFDNDLEGDVLINDISEYTMAYSNFISINHKNYVTYNETPTLSIGEKIKTIQLYKNKLQLPKPIELTEPKIETVEFINIDEEEDYIVLVESIINGIATIYIDYLSSSIEKEVLESKLQLLNALSDKTSIYVANILTSKSDKFARTQELTNILNKYWGKDTFRALNIYNFESIKNNKKVVETATQDAIINDIIDQVEMCKDDKESDFRDVFVTAPTGSGKSAMFQIPAIYLAEKYDLMTLVISPLIGLMNDQVYNLETAQYQYARTINSDISPIIREQIINEVAESKCHILYLSPESLLSRSDVEQLIGGRKIGMIVIDEAHIVTTWGKQFRPDYWYLGDHIRKLRKKQKVNSHPFVVATFTATAIYGGIEDMYSETINSLHLRRPITYLGYVKRDDIEIKIKELELNTNRVEYRKDKYNNLIDVIKRAEYTNKKTLIYFPTIGLINEFFDTCYSANLQKIVTKYHGKLESAEKEENYTSYKDGSKLVMLATKAFGMGIDINDIEIVCHFAPTGNVCDYVQEIGRAARRPDLKGEAIYSHMSNDFQHINRLHGLSILKNYQLVEVIKKIFELHKDKMNSKRELTLTKKRNEMLVDSESFSYIFDSPISDENDSINKVKTALLIIQKDYESRFGFSPFHMKPIPLFAKGFFMIDELTGAQLSNVFGSDVLKPCSVKDDIYELNLKYIWEKWYEKKMSFPKFKYLLYSKSDEIDFNEKFKLKTSLSIDIKFEENSPYAKLKKTMGEIFRRSAYNGKYYTVEEIAKELTQKTGVSFFKTMSLTNVLIAAMDNYKRNFANFMNNNVYKPKPLNNGSCEYLFNNPVNQFLDWIEKGYDYIIKNIQDGKLYLVEDGYKNKFKEYITILGILESMNALTFKTLGGANSQIYIYVNQTKTMQMVSERPNSYKNKLLEMVGQRHKLSVEMLSYIYQNKLTSEGIWNIIEDYFLGIIPEKVQIECSKRHGIKFEIRR